MSEITVPAEESAQPGAPTPQSPIPRPNLLGTIALGLAAFGFLLAVIPATAGLAWLLTLPALIVAIVGVTRKGQKKGTAIAGIVVSSVAWLVAVVVASASVLSGVSAADSAARDDGAPSAEESAADETVADEPAAAAPPAAAPPAAAPPAVEPAVEASAAAQPVEPQLTLAQENAVRSAESYLSFTHFSRPGLIGQLEYEGYSIDEATFAVDQIAPDWNAQAAGSAASYLEYSSFSRQQLLDQLLFEEYTPEQAEFGVASVGY